MSAAKAGRHASADYAHARETSVVGTVIADRYELQHRINGVEPRFKATDRRLGRDVAVCLPNLDVDSAELIQGTAARPPASSLQHPVLEPLLDVGYDLSARSSFIVTSYEPSAALDELSPSPELALVVLGELSSLLRFLHESGLGCSLPSARHVRQLIEPSADDYRLRVPLTCLYVRDGGRGLEADLAELISLAGALADPVVQPTESSPEERWIRLLPLLPARPAADLSNAERMLEFLSADHVRPAG